VPWSFSPLSSGFYRNDVIKIKIKKRADLKVFSFLFLEVWE